jgi:LysR family transcriptional regulator, flagellar master operon regulator
MNIEELRTFLTVVETKSLVAASRRLHVTQSTVTARLNALEDEVGQKLLHRIKSGAELTSPGFKFKRYAEVMLQLWGRARHEISLPNGFDGVCNVGLELSLWRDVGQRLLDHIRRHCPKIAAALWPGETTQLDRWLKTGLIDLALCYAPQASENFTSRALFDDEIVLVANTRSAHAPPAPGYIFVDHGDEFRRQHTEAFSTLATPITLASSDWAVDYLLGNEGSGYLPRRYAATLLGHDRFHVVAAAPVFRRRVYAVENTPSILKWDWYEAALAELSKGRPLAASNS